MSEGAIIPTTGGNRGKVGSKYGILQGSGSRDRPWKGRARVAALLGMSKAQSKAIWKEGRGAREQLKDIARALYLTQRGQEAIERGKPEKAARIFERAQRDRVFSTQPPPTPPGTPATAPTTAIERAEAIVSIIERIRRAEQERESAREMQRALRRATRQEVPPMGILDSVTESAGRAFDAITSQGGLQLAGIIGGTIQSRAKSKSAAKAAKYQATKLGVSGMAPTEGQLAALLMSAQQAGSPVFSTSPFMQPPAAYQPAGFGGDLAMQMIPSLAPALSQWINTQLGVAPSVMPGVVSGSSQAAIGDAFYLPTAGGQRFVPARMIMRPNPVTGAIGFWEYAGRPVLMSRDLAVCKRVQKITRRAAGRVGLRFRTRGRRR